MSGRLGSFLDSLSTELEHMLADVRFDFDTDASGVVGSGYNEFISGFGLFRRSRFSISVASRDFDKRSPRSCFELAQAAFHEVRHVRHHVERMRGNRSALSDDFTFAYLAREQNDMRYDLGYSDNIFELDANAYSVVEAKRFCKQFFPDADFYEIACDYAYSDICGYRL